MASDKKTVNLHELYEEKRQFPRVSVNGLATVEKPKEYNLSVILHDVSPDGVQIRCNRKTAGTIHPTGKFITESTAPVVKIKFSLPVEDKLKEVSVICKIFYFSIIDKDLVAFGVKFKQFENFSDRHVDAYISGSFVPVEEKVLKVLNTPHTTDDIINELDEENIDLDDTLNLLRKKKAIVSYEEDNKKKFVKMESAIQEIFKRLEKIEKQLKS